MIAIYNDSILMNRSNRVANRFKNQKGDSDPPSSLGAFILEGTVIVD